MIKAFYEPSEWKWRVWRGCWLLAAAWILIQGAFTRFTLPQWPLIAPDSFFYLLPSVNGGIYNIGPRTFVYPMFCRAVLQVTGDWRSLSVVQHLLGLLGPTLMLAAWWLLGTRIWISRLARAAHETIGLGLPLLLVPSAVYVIYEEQALLESFNAFLQCVLAALLCLLWLPMPSRRRLLLACFTAGHGIFMYYANPRWGASAPLVVALASLAALIGRDTLREWIRGLWPVLACSLATYFVLGQVQDRIVPRDPWLKTFTAKHLLWMHADLAINEFRRDLAANPPPANAEMLRKFVAKIEVEIVGIGNSHWQSLPFNANNILYVPDCPDAILAASFHDDPAGYNRFCLRYYARIVWHQPRAYFGKVWRMLRHYYVGAREESAFREFAVDLTDILPGSVPVVRYTADYAVPAERAKLEALASEMGKRAVPPVVFRPFPWFEALVKRIHVWFLGTSLIGAACATLILLWPRLRARPGLRVLAWLCLGSVAVLFAQVLTLALVTVTEGRYADALRTLAVFSLVCAVATTASLAVELVRQWARRKLQQLTAEQAESLDRFMEIIRHWSVPRVREAMSRRHLLTARQAESLDRFMEMIRRWSAPHARDVIVVAALALTCLLGLRLHALFTDPPTLIGAQGMGTAQSPYSDALGPWLHGSMSYYLDGVPLRYLYRPTIGLFFSTIISATNSIAAVPVVWIVLSLLACGALFALGGWSRRAALAGVLGVLLMFFPYLVRPLNPDTLMADFWPMVMGLTGIWLIALSEGDGPRSLPGAAAGFLLLGIAACVRGPQLASGAALLAWLAPGWLRRRDWRALILLPLVFAAPFLTDTAIQKKYGVEGNGSVSLYGFYSDPNHQWSPATHSRFLAEKPPAGEVRSRYLNLLFSAEGARIFSSKCAAVLSHASSLARERVFLLGLAALACLGWIVRGSEPPLGAAASVPRQWGRRLAVGLMIPAAAGLLLMGAEITRVVTFSLLVCALALHAACTGRRLTLLLMVAFFGALAFHAALGLNGGQRVIGNYEIFIFAALVSAVTEAPHAALPAPRALRLTAGIVILLVIVGYTGNFWLRHGFKADLRSQLAVPQTAVKLSDNPRLDRSLYLTGQMGLFYTRLDPTPFGTVRRYTTLLAPKGLGSVTLIEPCEVHWLDSDKEPVHHD